MALDFTPLHNAVARLDEGLARYLSDTSDEQIRDGLIQRFEFTYDLTAKMLRRVIEGLPERHRRYVLANRLDGMTFAAIAQRFGVSESLVRKTIDEAVAVCQRALANGTIDYRGLSRERNRRS